ncbi:leucine-rich repeat domain-containing protein [Flavobacterium sp. DGU38]|uniref:Leucine-rich repeat domain-containing protein n=1 Tax=Flavobacterium calami TaxID=3139144 RepID=A0ABU9IQE4_9FLAO
MIKNYLSLLAFCLFSSFTNAQIINIPDANFKAKLLQAGTSNQIALDINSSSIKIDANDNKEIEVSEAQKVGYLNLTNSQINSLEGISNFSNLKTLQCGSNSLTSLNVTSLSKLQFLRCDYNLIASLEISGLSELTSLFCNANRLTTLNLTGLSKLHTINFEYNKFTELDLTSLSNLYSLICRSNALTSLKLSGLSKLNNVDCEFNTFTSLEIKNLPALQRLDCSNSFSTGTLDLSGIPNLTWLDCSSNKFTTLDVSNLTKLKYLDCGFNKLATLDASNLKNLTELLCWRNELTSLNVNGLALLETLNFSENKFTSFTGTGLSKIKSLDLRGNKLTNLDISSSTSLESLFCSENLLTTLNLSGLNNLKLLYVNNNKLTNLDLTIAAKLTKVYCQNNLLTNINVANSIYLAELYIDTNQLSSIDLTGLTNLSILSCSANKFADINILGLKNLTEFYCTTNALTKIDLTGLTKLSTLACGRNQLSNLNVLGLSNLKLLYCHRNLLTALDLTGLTNLALLNCGYNQFSTLNVSGLTGLKEFYCTNNQITDLDLSGLTNLGVLEAGNNLLTKLNVSGLKKLQMLSFENNTVETIDLSGLQNIMSFNCSNNKLKNLDFSTVIYTPQQGFMGSDTYTYEYADGMMIFMTMCDYTLNNNQFELINLKNSNGYSVSFSDNNSLKYICVNDDKIQEIEEAVTKYGYTDCHVNSYCSFKPGGINYVIQGNARIDSNNNGCDALDIPASNLKFIIDDTVKNKSIINNATGSYMIPVSAGNYKVTPTLENPDYFTTSPGFVNVVFPSVASPFSQNFCLVPNGLHKDLEINILPTQPARPGFDAKYKIIYKNKGNVTQSGSVNLIFDDTTLDFVSSNVTFSSQTTGNIAWDFTNLKAFETREIEIILNVNTPTEIPAVNNNDILSYTVKINSAETDEMITDNTFELNQTVVGSYDPNDKTCLEGNVIKPGLIGEYVHYMIRFENTGTYQAENVVVKDLIDLSKFDINTLVPTSSSHSYITKISDGNKVEFIFEKINLPFDDVNNDGYIAFKIKTLPTLTVGDSFTNEANIYFDYNLPILTNKATSTFKTTLGNQDFDFGNYFTIYPVPAKDVLNIGVKETIEIKSIAVYDVLGQIVIAVPNAEKVSTVDVSKLQKGNYILKIKTNIGTSASKFIKM